MFLSLNEANLHFYHSGFKEYPIPGLPSRLRTNHLLPYYKELSGAACKQEDDLAPKRGVLPPAPSDEFRPAGLGAVGRHIGRRRSLLITGGCSPLPTLSITRPSRESWDIVGPSTIC